MKPIPNVSAAVTLLVRQECAEVFAYKDLSAYHAPSECYMDVDRLNGRRRRVVHRQIHALTGMPYRVFFRRLRKQYPQLIDGNGWGRMMNRVYWKHYPF